ncbi:MAG TPA: hypothetical protein VL244_13850, partial [Alphaproteobacteria bacterium]|nr:hypothetical protein [Alphaproteobacteria bacterium]
MAGQGTNMRVGIVGCGLIGQKRALAAVASGNTVTHAADVDLARAEALLLAARSPGQGVTDWRAVIAARP